MYEPLQFMEQIKYMVGAGTKFNEMLSTRSVDYFTKYFDNSDNSKNFIKDFANHFLSIRDGYGFKDVSDLNKYSKVREEYYNALELDKELIIMNYITDSDYDFFTLMLQQYIYYDWRFHKLTYKLSDHIGKSLASMDLPSKAVYSCLLNLPATTFCIDLTDTDIGYCKDLKMIYLTTSTNGEELNLILTPVMQGNHGRLMPIFMSQKTFLNGEETGDEHINFKLSSKRAIHNVHFEDGETRVVDVHGIQVFVVNFLIYLQAINKDIEPHEAIKDNFNKPIDRTKECKNKFRELRLYNVGYKLSTALPKKSYKNNSLEGKGSPKSPHYRSAHWHHYWTGSKEDRELIIKWVEGVFVNGKAEPKVATVHTVS